MVPLPVCCCPQAEEHLYYRSSQLVSFLREWKGTAPTVAGRYEELMIQLYEREYVGLKVSHWS